MSSRTALASGNERNSDAHSTLASSRSEKGSSWSSRSLGARCRNSIASCTDEQPHIGNYRLLKTIGKGNFAKVKLARHILTGREVAIKIIDKTQLNPTSLQKLFREVRIMKGLNHPNIVKLFEVIETEKTLYLVMEYASAGEVFDYLVSHGRMKEKEARAKFRQELRERVLRGKYRVPFYMSTDCETILRRFLVLNPAKRCTLEQIMKDKWINIGYEGDELKPYKEPEEDFGDTKRIEVMVGMGYTREEIKEALNSQKYNEVTATYLLLGRKNEVEGSESRTGSSLSLARVRAPSEVSNGTSKSSSHGKSQRSSSTYHRQRRHSDFCGPSPVPMHPKRSPTSTGEAELKEERMPSRKASCSVVSSGRGIPPSSPMVSSANNPNKSEIPDRRKDSTINTNNIPSSVMTRRNTYVCTERPGADRHSLLHNGKENSSITNRVPPASPSSHSIATSSSSSDRTRLSRGTTIRSTFHGGQVRDRRGTVQNGPPTSPTLSHEATPLPQSRSRATSNLFSKLTSKLTRRVADEPERIGGPALTSCNLPWNQKEAEPRLLRCTWNVKVTSTHPPEAMMAALRQATDSASCHCHQLEPFLLSCTHAKSASEHFCHFEAEVCRLQRLGLTGVLFRRLAGTSLAFRTVVTSIASQLQL
ncbi:MAP/microtubule affinity-regulating kinase 4 [Chelonoidis abingdonii]|uniref:MAP/microtubule affinity-regulating kinase 4 n=1 Tax=Chelonoidis abingdonii TaxID=106734 RepID=UPI0013F23369|nr:MAP/microtubule affinity-regulating kinase 4 [Chelonoidis abingdonii]